MIHTHVIQCHTTPDTHHRRSIRLRNDDKARAGVIFGIRQGRPPVFALFIRHPGMFRQGRHRGLPLRNHGAASNRRTFRKS
ncbi:MAG: hypothetical protein Q3M30_11950 [Candidatus Electrothrix sp. Rat3]|nr:hypothetical protein [Candidatus Electrothrix rattekaaiensis]